MSILFLAIIILLAVLPFVNLIMGKRKKNSVQSDSTTKYISEEQNTNSGKKKNDFLIISTSLWIAGLMVVFAGFNLLHKEKQFRENGTKTIAVITDVIREEYTDQDGETQERKNFKITYKVNGKQYNNVIKNTQISASKGHELEIYYNSHNPAEFISTDDSKEKYKKNIVLGLIVIASPFIYLFFKKIVQLIKNHKHYKKIIR